MLPIATIIVFMTFAESLRATIAPQYPPIVAPTIIRMAWGQYIIPANPNVMTEAKDNAKDIPFFKPFIRLISRIPRVENKAKRTIPNPPLKYPP